MGLTKRRTDPPHPARILCVGEASSRDSRECSITSLGLAAGPRGSRPRRRAGGGARGAAAGPVGEQCQCTVTTVTDNRQVRKVGFYRFRLAAAHATRFRRGTRSIAVHTTIFVEGARALAAAARSPRQPPRRPDDGTASHTHTRKLYKMQSPTRDLIHNTRQGHWPTRRRRRSLALERTAQMAAARLASSSRHTSHTAQRCARDGAST